MENVQIKKVKLIGEYSAQLEYTKSITTKLGDDETTVTNDYVVTMRNQPHTDFINSMNKLIPHVILLCEIGDYGSVEAIPDKELQKIEVTGITIGGHDEHEGVVVIAKKRLKHNKVVNLITPFTKWEDEHNGYTFERLLQIACFNVLGEAELYLNGKYAPNPQLEIQFETENA